MLMRLGARATVKTEERPGLFHFDKKLERVLARFATSSLPKPWQFVGPHRIGKRNFAEGGGLKNVPLMSVATFRI